MVKILLMDDEQGLRNVVYNMLKPFGYTLFVSEDGHQAIEVAGKENPDIALLDMRVPDMDGLEVLKELKKMNPNIKCIMLSGFGDVETAVSALKQGAFDYISKPFKMEDVLGVVSKAIQTISPGAQPLQPAKAPAPAASPQPAKPQSAPAPAAAKAETAEDEQPKESIMYLIQRFMMPKGLIILGAVAVLAAAGFILKGSLGKSGINEFSIPYTNPTGMCWIKSNLWVTDWVMGNVYQHNNDASFSIAGAFKIANAQPTGIAFDGESLWTCSSMERRIYKHRMDGALTAEAIFATTNSNPSGMYFDGANIWVLDSDAAKIYKHKMDEMLSVVGVQDSPAINPCGMFRSGEYFYIGDYKTSKIYKVSVKDFVVAEVYGIPYFEKAGYKLAGLTWDGKNIWASADGVGKVFSFTLKSLKPVKL